MTWPCSCLLLKPFNHGRPRKTLSRCSRVRRLPRSLSLWPSRRLRRPASSTMALSRQTRARPRPRISPIQTKGVDWAGLARSVFMPRKSCFRPASPMSPGTLPEPASLDSRESIQRDGSAGGSEPEGCTRVTGAANLATPKEAMRGATDCGPASDTCHSAKLRLSLPSDDVAMSGTESPCSASFGGPPGRRQSVATLTAAARSLHFQRFREGLRRRGSKEFGNIGTAGVLVMPLELRRPSTTNGEESQQEESPPIPENGPLPIRVVIRSKDRSPVGLRRDFDLSELRATVPEALPSPRPPNFDRGALLAAIPPEGAAPLPTCPASAPGSRRASVDTGSSESAPSLLPERKHCAGPRSVPMRK